MAMDRADDLDPQLGAYLSRFYAEAMESARRADEDFARGIDRGPLQGIPIAVKDVILTREGRTTANSHVVDEKWAGGIDARVVANLRAAGAVITGKTSTNEFAFGAPDTDPAWLFPRNPWNLDCWAGGSSAGSGSGVAAGLFCGAVGTDTAGSVRMPAAYCGVVGFKPSTGRLSSDGVIPLSWTLDVVGPLARTVHDAAILADGMMEPDDWALHHDLTRDIAGSIGGVRVGVDRVNHLQRPQMDADLTTRFDEALAVLRDAGATLKDVAIPAYREIVDAVMITIFVEGFTYHHDHLRTQAQAFCPASRIGLAQGALFSARDIVLVNRGLAAARRMVQQLFTEVDLIVSPTAVNVAPSVTEGYDMSEVVAALCTPVWNGVGSPAISVPMGANRAGLPFGLQIAGRIGEDALVLRAAAAFELSTDWKERTSPVAALRFERRKAVIDER